MEIKRYSSVYFLVRKMKKDLFSVNANNPADGVNLLNLQLKNFKFSSVCKKISTNKWKKIN